MINRRLWCTRLGSHYRWCRAKLGSLLRWYHTTLDPLHDFWRAKFGPQLWRFRQHPPCPLRIPPNYHEDSVPEDAPPIAIVTPSFNQAKYLKSTIDSVLSQNYPRLTYIVQDGASGDGSVELLKSYGDRLSWRTQPDSGQGDAINRGFTQIDGEIMAYLNSDDFLLPGALASVSRAFLAHPNIDLIYGHRIYVDQEGNEIGRCVLPPHDPEALKWADYVPQETMFWRRCVWVTIGPIDNSFHYALDWDFILRAQAAGFKFKRLPRFLACFRVHDEQKTSAKQHIGADEMNKLRRTHLGRDPTPAEIELAIRPYLSRQIGYHWLNKIGILAY